MAPRVLLCEDDESLAGIFIDLFSDEHIEVTRCSTLEQLEASLDQYPGATIVTDSWTNSWQADLSPVERRSLLRLAERTHVIVTTGRAWGQHAAELDLGPNITVIAKPFDIEDVVRAVRSVS